MSTKKKNGIGLQRREFMKLSASSVAVYLTGCAPEALVPAPAPLIPIPANDGNVLDPELAWAESWQEPWTWRPELWPDSSLDLNVVQNQNPGMSPSQGNISPMLFSFNGSSPGPSIRVRNDGVLHVKIRNMLGLNNSMTHIGPSPDRFDLPPDVENEICRLAEEQGLSGDPENLLPCASRFPELLSQIVNPELRPGWSLKGHFNGKHAAHTTNLHTHGLHVFPQTNPDGSYSDDVHLRIIPNADWAARLASDNESLHTLAHNEHVGSLNYKLQLAFERDGKMMPHPPGTHWYHPHSHGSTHDQVSSGMAGFLIVEGDVDDAINLAMTGSKQPDPEEKTGPFDYRERLIFIQRVIVPSNDPDAGARKDALRIPPINAVNGIREPGLIRIRPGSVERWRVLNGSVDGAGTKRFMVLDGHFVQRNNRVWRVTTDGERGRRKRRFERVTEQEIEDAKLNLHQLSLDGITLVTEDGGKCRHEIRDLAKQNAGSDNPMALASQPGENEYQTRLRALESVFTDGDSLRRAFVRPNEAYLTNGNRTDLIFKAPIDSGGRVFTVIAKEAHIHTDNYQRFLQRRIFSPKSNARRELFDVIVAHIHVDGDPVDGGDFDIQDLNAHLPPVPPFLRPVTADELVIPTAEAEQTGAQPGSKRCRTISYSGIGGADFPLVEVPEEFCAANPKLENLVWGTSDGRRVLIPSVNNTMAINTEFDLVKHPVPNAPRKFMPADELGSRMLVDTAEEWVIYNSSMMMWCHRDMEKFPQPGSYNAHFDPYPLSRADGQRRYAKNSEFMISAKANDHPFHIHINPMWVIRIDVPDENGDLHNILPTPMWMDTVAIPRDGGRVVFRSRFDDFVGKWVNHCHVLSHEDNGMMQEVECTDNASRANYNTREQVASHSMSSAEVDAIYPKPSREIMYQQNMTFIDPNEVGYQEYPGFELPDAEWT